MGEAAKVCPDCATEATAVRGRRRGAPRLWWCWRCEKHIRPIPNQDAEGVEPGLADPTGQASG